MLLSKNLLSPIKKWCPLCLNGWNEKKVEIYEPLVWSISDVKVCNIHKSKLQERCPTPGCNRNIPLFSRYSAVGYCSFCNEWLGTISTTQSQVEYSEKLIWTANEVGSLIRVNLTNMELKKESLKSSFQRLCTQLAHGNIW
ncbi:TniQ family protein [Paenibacillus gyeongsangnamensis]|uniref:TniQ family protein n=1 Tax=Paenibacillus gyeongsangnamensis TaxID=3388067 RepID=UPI0039080E12